jgi:hypothetical protein
MKKNFISVVWASVMMLCAGAVFAQGEPQFYENQRKLTVYTKSVAENFKDNIVIDGLENDDSWAGAGVSENSIDRILHDWGMDPVVNTWGYAATFKAVYDYLYLYLFVKVTDNEYVPYNATKDDITVDNVEMFFYPDPAERDMVDETVVTQSTRPNLSQLRATVGNTGNRATGTGLVAGQIKDNKLTGYEYKSVQTPAGYNLEIKVPLDFVIPEQYIYDLNDGLKILFDINPANVITGSADRKIILGWSTDDYHSWKANFKMGELTFGGVYTGSSIGTLRASSVKYAFKDGGLQLFDAESGMSVSVYDLSGRKVASALYEGQAISLAQLASGVYVVDVKGVGNFKIVK